MEYRIAEEKDCEALTCLRMEMRRERDGDFSEEDLYASTLDFFRRNLKSGAHVAFVGEDGGKIIATAGLSLFEMPPTAKLPDGKVAKLMNAYVTPPYRRQGIGSELVKFVLSYAARQGYHKIMLNASPMGVGLYEKLGFTRIPNEYERYV